MARLLSLQLPINAYKPWVAFSKPFSVFYIVRREKTSTHTDQEEQGMIFPVLRFSPYSRSPEK